MVLGRFHVISIYQAELPNYTVISAAPRISCHLPRESPCALHLQHTVALSLHTHTHIDARTDEADTFLHAHVTCCSTCACHGTHTCTLFRVFHSVSIKFLPIFGRYNISKTKSRIDTHTRCVAHSRSCRGGTGRGRRRRWWWEEVVVVLWWQATTGLIMTATRQCRGGTTLENGS